MGSLPASTEIVLEIQLNELIRDFLFSGVGDDNVSRMWNGSTEAENADFTVETERHNADPKPCKVDKVSVESTPISYNEDNKANESLAWELDHMRMVPIGQEHQNRSVGLNGCGSTTSNRPSNKLLRSPAGEIRINIRDQMSNICSPQHTKTVKLFRLSKTHSILGSLFCFFMQKRCEHKAKVENDRASGNSLKLTEVRSLPCNTKLCGENDERYKYTCQKPPRPPKPPSEKASNLRDATGEAVVVLHGASKHARSEKKKRRAGLFSSNASIWALIFTLLFALAMLRERILGSDFRLYIK